MSRWEQNLLNTSQDKMGSWGDVSRDIHSLLTSSVSCLWPGICDAQWPWRTWIHEEWAAAFPLTLPPCEPQVTATDTEGG